MPKEKEYPATVQITDTGLYTEVHHPAEQKPVFDRCLPLFWANGDLAGAVDVAKDGTLIGIELVGWEEFRNPSPMDF